MKELKEFNRKEEYAPRTIQYLVVHCSATRANIPFTKEQLLQCHLKRGFKCIGYHFYVTKDGVLHHTRPMGEIGAHALGFNLHSLGICYEGGLDETGKPADTRTAPQKETLRRVLGELKRLYPEARIAGHYQLSADVHKACPCFDARGEYADL
ncbi:N-acetylmuramoyl-L-alanine amidase [uncultured Bacteroides sp.]|uniref:N-acetylmuramoyl-L-alanine amidase n=1 Tax=uncultured Bacteroides sp. TaxID=162156 RepID=UPI0025F31046|nr:N-acetylmuramoyl-L-alanine amidase [uncultured Bacteroides sp.]